MQSFHSITLWSTTRIFRWACTVQAPPMRMELLSRTCFMRSLGSSILRQASSRTAMTAWETSLSAVTAQKTTLRRWSGEPALVQKSLETIIVPPCKRISCWNRGKRYGWFFSWERETAKAEKTCVRNTVIFLRWIKPMRDSRRSGRRNLTSCKFRRRMTAWIRSSIHGRCTSQKSTLCFPGLPPLSRWGAERGLATAIRRRTPWRFHIRIRKCAEKGLCSC